MRDLFFSVLQTLVSNLYRIVVFEAFVNVRGRAEKMHVESVEKSHYSYMDDFHP